MENETGEYESSLETKTKHKSMQSSETDNSNTKNRTEISAEDKAVMVGNVSSTTETSMLKKMTEEKRKLLKKTQTHKAEIIKKTHSIKDDAERQALEKSLAELGTTGSSKHKHSSDSHEKQPSDSAKVMASKNEKIKAFDTFISSDYGVKNTGSDLEVSSSLLSKAPVKKTIKATVEVKTGKSRNASKKSSTIFREATDERNGNIYCTIINEKYCKPSKKYKEGKRKKVDIAAAENMKEENTSIYEDIVERKVKEIRKQLETMSKKEKECLLEPQYGALDSSIDSVLEEGEICPEVEEVEDSSVYATSGDESPVRHKLPRKKYWSDASETEQESDSEMHLMHFNSVNIVLKFLKSRRQEYLKKSTIGGTSFHSRADKRSYMNIESQLKSNQRQKNKNFDIKGILPLQESRMEKDPYFGPKGTWYGPKSKKSEKYMKTKGKGHPYIWEGDQHHKASLIEKCDQSRKRSPLGESHSPLRNQGSCSPQRYRKSSFKDSGSFSPPEYREIPSPKYRDHSLEHRKSSRKKKRSHSHSRYRENSYPSDRWSLSPTGYSERDGSHPRSRGSPSPARYGESSYPKSRRSPSPARYGESSYPKSRGSPARYGESSYPKSRRSPSPARYGDSSYPKNRGSPSPARYGESSYPKSRRSPSPARYGESSYPKSRGSPSPARYGESSYPKSRGSPSPARYGVSSYPKSRGSPSPARYRVSSYPKSRGSLSPARYGESSYPKSQGSPSPARYGESSYPKSRGSPSPARFGESSYPKSRRSPSPARYRKSSYPKSQDSPSFPHREVSYPRSQKSLSPLGYKDRSYTGRGSPSPQRYRGFSPVSTSDQHSYYNSRKSKSPLSLKNNLCSEHYKGQSSHSSKTSEFLYSRSKSRERHLSEGLSISCTESQWGDDQSQDPRRKPKERDSKSIYQKIKLDSYDVSSPQMEISQTQSSPYSKSDLSQSHKKCVPTRRSRSPSVFTESYFDIQREKVDSEKPNPGVNERDLSPKCWQDRSATGDRFLPERSEGKEIRSSRTEGLWNKEAVDVLYSQNLNKEQGRNIGKNQQNEYAERSTLLTVNPVKENINERYSRDTESYGGLIQNQREAQTTGRVTKTQPEYHNKMSGIMPVTGEITHSPTELGNAALFGAISNTQTSSHEKLYPGSHSSQMKSDLSQETRTYFVEEEEPIIERPEDYLSQTNDVSRFHRPSFVPNTPQSQNLASELTCADIEATYVSSLQSTSSVRKDSHGNVENYSPYWLSKSKWDQNDYKEVPQKPKNPTCVDSLSRPLESSSNMSRVDALKIDESTTAQDIVNVSSSQTTSKVKKVPCGDSVNNTINWLSDSKRDQNKDKVPNKPNNPSSPRSPLESTSSNVSSANTLKSLPASSVQDDIAEKKGKEEDKAMLTLNTAEMNTLLALIQIAKEHVASGTNLPSESEISGEKTGITSKLLSTLGNLNQGDQEHGATLSQVNSGNSNKDINALTPSSNSTMPCMVKAPDQEKKHQQAITKRNVALMEEYSGNRPQNDKLSKGLKDHGHIKSDKGSKILKSRVDDHSERKTNSTAKNIVKDDSSSIHETSKNENKNDPSITKTKTNNSPMKRKREDTLPEVEKNKEQSSNKKPCGMKSLERGKKDDQSSKKEGQNTKKIYEFQRSQDSKFDRTNRGASLVKETLMNLNSVFVCLGIMSDKEDFVSHKREGKPCSAKRTTTLRSLKRSKVSNLRDDSLESSPAKKIMTEELQQSIGDSPKKSYQNKTISLDCFADECLNCQDNLILDEYTTISLNTGTVTMRCPNCFTYTKMHNVMTQDYAMTSFSSKKFHTKITISSGSEMKYNASEVVKTGNSKNIKKSEMSRKGKMKKTAKYDQNKEESTHKGDESDDIDMIDPSLRLFPWSSSRKKKKVIDDITFSEESSSSSDDDYCPKQKQRKEIKRRKREQLVSSEKTPDTKSNTMTFKPSKDTECRSTFKPSMDTKSNTVTSKLSKDIKPNMNTKSDAIVFKPNNNTKPSMNTQPNTTTFKPSKGTKLNMNAQPSTTTFNPSAAFKPSMYTKTSTITFKPSMGTKTSTTAFKLSPTSKPSTDARSGVTVFRSITRISPNKDTKDSEMTFMPSTGTKSSMSTTKLSMSAMTNLTTFKSIMDPKSSANT